MIKINFFNKDFLDKNLNFIKLLLITLFIFFFDIKFKIFSILFDLRLFSILLFPIMIYEYRIHRKYNNFILIFFLILIFLLLHYFLNIFNNKIPFNIYSIVKIISGFLILSSIFYYKEFVLININKIINMFLIIFFFIILAFNIISFFNNSFSLNCFFGCFSVNRFLFLENSHLAYISSLIIFFYIFNSLKKDNIKFIVFFLFFLISLIKNQSTTLLTSNIIISTFFLIFYSKNLDKFKFVSFLCIFVLSSIFIVSPFHKEKVDDFVNIFHQEKKQDNLTFVLSPPEISNVKNLSSDVYFFNSKIAFNSLIDRPFGWGLYNYQFAHQKYSKITKSYLEGSSWLNNDDGANILFKSIVEMGIFSFLLYIPFLYFLFCKKINFQYKLLLAPPIITQVLIRGSGFFNGGFIVFIILYFYLVFKKN